MQADKTMTTTIHISIYDAASGQHIKGWPNWSGALPQTGDTLLLHFGDDYEQEERCTVVSRQLDGRHPDVLRVYVSRQGQP